MPAGAAHPPDEIFQVAERGSIRPEARWELRQQRTEPPRFGQRLNALGKAPKVIRIALARKLLIIANAVLRDNKAWTLKTA